jgi:hypothetical protein
MHQKFLFFCEIIPFRYNNCIKAHRHRIQAGDVIEKAELYLGGEEAEWIQFLYKKFSDKIYRIIRICLLRFRFPEETENMQSAFSGIFKWYLFGIIILTGSIVT